MNEDLQKRMLQKLEQQYDLRIGDTLVQTSKWFQKPIIRCGPRRNTQRELVVLTWPAEERPKEGRTYRFKYKIIDFDYTSVTVEVLEFSPFV